MAPRKKLNKGEVAGIALLAEYHVICELGKVIESTGELSKTYQVGLRKAFKTAVPKVFESEKELQRQIKLCRKRWLKELEKEGVVLNENKNQKPAQ